MTTIRATRLLAQTLGVKLAAPSDAVFSSDTKLGEWYGNVMQTSIGMLVVLINAPTRVALVSQCLHPVRLIRELPQRLARLLDKLGVPTEAVRKEVRGFGAVVFTKTVDRRFIGSLNEVCHQIAAYDEYGDLHAGEGLCELEDDLAHLVHLPLRETFPENAVRALLGGVDPKVR